MDDGYQHPTAARSTRLQQLRALAADGNGATDAERENARRRLAEYEAKIAREPTPPAPIGGPYWANLDRADISDDIKQAVRDAWSDMEAFHEAEVHAGKIGTFVVWRADRDDADYLQCLGAGHVRLPDGQRMKAKRSRGLIHDTDQDRWGVLYRASDLRPV